AAEERIGVELRRRSDNARQVFAATLNQGDAALSGLAQRTRGRDAGVGMRAATAVGDVTPELTLDDGARQRRDSDGGRDVPEIDGETGAPQPPHECLRPRRQG